MVSTPDKKQTETIKEEANSNPITTQEITIQNAKDVEPAIQTQQKPQTNSPLNHVSSLSLKGLKRKKEILEKKTVKEVDVSKLPREPFTEIALNAVWKEYVNRLQKRGEKILASNLETDTPTLKGTVIHLEFPNETMRVELERAQHSLLEFLKRKLNNYDISIEITVNEAAERKYAYSPREKYEKLKEKNPDLEILRTTFDLDI